jgi:Spy/CpxP family protein refolding chaperone
MFVRMLSAALIGLSISTAALAQDHQHHQAPARMTQMHQGMMGIMGMMGECALGNVPAPALLLGVREQLELTPSQVTRLEALNREVAAAREQHADLAVELHRQAAEILGADAPDFQAYQGVLEQMATIMVPFHAVVAKAAVAARSTLTPEQRTRLADLASREQGMMSSCMPFMHSR